jgi:hypothetical protein
MTVADVTGAAQRIRGRVHDVKPGESKFVALERIDVPQHERGDERWRQLRGIADQFPDEWQSYAAVVEFVEGVTGAEGPWAETSTEHTVREAILCGLLQDRRNDRGEPEVRRNPDPPLPKTAQELLDEQTERAAAEERRMVAEELEARERVSREHYERTVEPERQFVRDVVAPQFEELHAEIRELRELIESSQGTEE